MLDAFAVEEHVILHSAVVVDLVVVGPLADIVTNQLRFSAQRQDLVFVRSLKTS